MFENVAVAEGWPFIRAGFNRPPLDMSKLPQMVNYTPDYLTEFGYVEVQGFGKDRIFKLKDTKLEALKLWDDVFVTHLFAWDNVTRTWALFHVSHLEQHPPNMDGTYPEGKTWMGWTPYYLDVTWKPYGTQ